METTTDQRAGLTDVDAVLSSFRPGGFELRLQADELIPMRHGVIGQETQGPGGMMMSFRSIQVDPESSSTTWTPSPRTR